MRSPRTKGSLLRPRRGSAAVEFALSLIFILTPMLAAVLEWGSYYSQELQMLQVLRDGVRVAVSDTVPTSSAETTAEDWIDHRLAEMGYDYSDDTVVVDTVEVGGFDMLQVTLQVEYIPIFFDLPVLNAGHPPEFLGGTYQMRL